MSVVQEVWPRFLETRFELPENSGIQDVFRWLASDQERNRQITSDILSAYQEGRRIIVLSGRTEQVDLLESTLSGQIEHLFVLHGRLTKRHRVSVLANLEALDDAAPRVLLATAALVGEGFDHPPLDTLVLTTPISWEGSIKQYAGRLHREHTLKTDVRIYDYVEAKHPQLARMWEKRRKGYLAMGYHIKPVDSEIVTGERPHPDQLIA